MVLIWIYFCDNILDNESTCLLLTIFIEIVINHVILRETLKLREHFGTDLQQKRT